MAAIVSGCVTFGLALGFAAAGLWPRLDLLRESNVAGGEYTGHGSRDYALGWSAPEMLDKLLSDGNGYFTALYYLGAPAVALGIDRLAAGPPQCSRCVLLGISAGNIRARARTGHAAPSPAVSDAPVRTAARARADADPLDPVDRHRRPCRYRPRAFAPARTPPDCQGGRALDWHSSPSRHRVISPWESMTAISAVGRLLVNDGSCSYHVFFKGRRVVDRHRAPSPLALIILIVVWGQPDGMCSMPSRSLTPENPVLSLPGGPVSRRDNCPERLESRSEAALASFSNSGSAKRGHTASSGTTPPSRSTPTGCRARIASGTTTSVPSIS